MFFKAHEIVKGISEGSLTAISVFVLKILTTIMRSEHGLWIEMELQTEQTCWIA